MVKTTASSEFYDAIRQAGPSFYPDLSWNHMGEYDDYQKRGRFVKEYAWALPSPDVIRAIVAFADGGTILEIGAGSGLWAHLLREAGAEIRATDVEPWDTTYTFVAQLSATEALALYPDAHVLMLCWPPYADPLGALALAVFTGDRLVYIGEGEGGCTGDDTFHAMLSEFWEVEEPSAMLPQWPGLHDCLDLYRRKSSWENQRMTIVQYLEALREKPHS